MFACNNDCRFREIPVYSEENHKYTSGFATTQDTWLYLSETTETEGM